MRTRRRPVAVGAIATSVLLLATTACSSAADDSSGESLPAVAVETTVDATGPTDATTPSTESTGDTTVAPTPDSTSGGDGPSTTEVAAVVPEALRFTAPLVGGGTFDGEAVAGKPTVFWFWAPT